MHHHGRRGLNLCGWAPLSSGGEFPIVAAKEVFTAEPSATPFLSGDPYSTACDGSSKLPSPERYWVSAHACPRTILHLPLHHGRRAADWDDEMSAGGKEAETARRSVNVGWWDVVSRGDVQAPCPYPTPFFPPAAVRQPLRGLLKNLLTQFLSHYS
jgi:hypothetical protein